jgi:hypothetical protein
MSIGGSQGGQAQQGTGGNDFQGMIQKFLQSQAGGQQVGSGAQAGGRSATNYSQQVPAGQGGSAPQGGGQSQAGGRSATNYGQQVPAGQGAGGPQGQGGGGRSATNYGQQVPAGQGGGSPQGGGGQMQGAQAQPSLWGSGSAYAPVSATGLQPGMNAGGSGGQNLAVGQTPQPQTSQYALQGVGGQLTPGPGGQQTQAGPNWSAQGTGAQAQPGPGGQQDQQRQTVNYGQQPGPGGQQQEDLMSKLNAMRLGQNRGPQAY